MFKKLIHGSIKNPKLVMMVTFLVVLVAGFQLPRIKVDTDPENMLSEKEFVRVFHHAVKKEFSLYDFIVVGIINEEDKNGVFNVNTLNNIYAITDEIKKIDGVIAREIISPSTKDNVRQGDIGSVVFEWLMKEPITSEAEALFIRDEAQDNPLFNGTMVSENGKALCLYVPIEKKTLSYAVAQEIREIVKKIEGNEKFHITGLPVAEDTFGIEMFKQMAISAPLAGLIIFLLMFFFFRNFYFIVSPMILAVATVITTMGLLIGFGFPVHIMSSMIPIFLMPIAVLDSVHILSDFFDTYHIYGNKKDTIKHVMSKLFTPMLYTSVTSAVGFFSLSFSPIPPVQAFGVFVAVGIMIAWVLTLTFIPAYIALISEKNLARFSHQKTDLSSKSVLDRLLRQVGNISLTKSKWVLSITGVFLIVSIYGISKIQVNDNPVKWFSKNHEIRIADKILNRHFGGTYTAYLVLDGNKAGVFKEPVMLEYIKQLQQYLADKGDVGKSTSLADVVRKVFRELLGGDDTYDTIPQSKRAVAQCLLSYESSHKPDDLWHLTNPDYSKVNIWLQLKSGDNKVMERVLRQVKTFFEENTSPEPFEYNWAGLTYINVVWQNKMVVGMLKNFLGSFIIVFFIMTFLFKSPVKGLVSMIPLSVAILFIYGLLGLVGKDYDMPVAILSALTLGLSIDFAIHFIQRTIDIYKDHPDWKETAVIVFQEPSRAIARNALIIAIGFLPLLAAPLVPYKTVGFFMFAIMLVSSIATLFILPAIITLFPGIISKKKEKNS